tara:strand:- start:618 stop:761 length:144 start_codon:yes stop_codon:yes gene_type:complete
LIILRVSTRLFWKGPRIETIEEVIKEYEEILNEAWERTNKRIRRDAE